MEISYITPYDRKSWYVVFSSLFITPIGLAVIMSFPAYASSEAYDSGYDHGCDDANIPPSERYINEVGKGPSYHTDKFMEGYHDGFENCSVGEGAYSQDTSDFPELKEGEHYGECEERSVGLVCDIESE